MNRLRQTYQEEVRPALQKELELKNVHQIPRIEKVVVNAGVGRAASDSKQLESVSQTIAKVTGQAPVATSAKQSIAGFKLREGNKIGVMVTLRGERMYAFLDRLVSIVLPRTRDFRGLSEKAFDQQGNYSIGINDQSVFPELSFEETVAKHGLQVNIVTKAMSPEASRLLLQKLGFPLRRSS